MLAQVILGSKAVNHSWCTHGESTSFYLFIYLFVSVKGAHGRFVLLGEGGVVREARTQTLEPDVWIREVQQRGHGTRRRLPLSHLELYAVALPGRDRCPEMLRARET